ncbi:aminotransferase class I/II-fold pyridoxal phosphate-dependent enzyme [Cohnella zeiphila]|uniref:Aminotransferase class I/II-fold pyridoxal phosphate-dependent enzyme n=1 Tax=Cohnella zeiphila TaxID=2761120 RepID=A0A7X0SQU6_9BACL|nr:aminotransferase class I/II-fold pyridoxal phosphate-dependent enzyme [Cohnella zeiphila]MBB6733409.1 aminotransferase class I/II-fold pyridoxal phosphate-dependent enzyme [Cohnella zeiphila]
MTLNADRAPLFEALIRHAGRKPDSFHVPGHKGKAAWTLQAAEERYARFLEIDVTELSDTDDLHHPEGVIAEAQKLAADCFGAEETRFLVGGSTAGNLAMILAVCRPGELLLVQRNVHKSIIHGLMLAGARAVFLPPETEPGSGLAVAPSERTVREALHRYPEAKSLLLSNPNYYGLAADLSKMVQSAHERDIPVLVDEAHGAHFGQHPAFPRSALRFGADAVVQSAHKMLSAMTMGAMLHMQGERLDRESVRSQLRMLQSSSPSYPIMASLDLARRELHTRKAECFEQALLASSRIREGIAPLPFAALSLAPEGAWGLTMDPLKLVLYDETGTLDGFRLRDELEKQGCLAEMADDRFVVLALGTGTEPSDGERLVDALRAIAPLAEAGEAGKRENGWQRESEPEQRPIPEPVAFRRGAERTETVRLEDAEGRISGEWVIPYPPGVPELFPGERIERAAVERLRQWQRRGARIQGAADASLRHLQVWIES